MTTTTETPSLDDDRSLAAHHGPRFRQSPPARSAFAETVPDLTELTHELQVVARHLVAAALLVLLVGFPGQLFNKTLEENYERVRAWFRRAPQPLSKFTRLPRPLQFLGFTSLAAFLYTALDPSAGIDRATFTLLIGLFCAISVVTLAFQLPVGLYTRRVCGRACFLRTFPGAMLLAVGFVVLSRVADFQPGYLYGLIAGYALLDGGEVSKQEQGRGVALGTVCLLILSVAAWIAWIPVNRTVNDGSGLALLLVDAILVAVFVAGLESLAFGLVPLRFVDGYKLAQWNRPLWLLLQLVAMFGFVHVILDPHTQRVDSSTNASVVGMLVLFLLFGAISIMFWAYFRFRAEQGDTLSVQP